MLPCRGFTTPTCSSFRGAPPRMSTARSAQPRRCRLTSSPSSLTSSSTSSAGRSPSSSRVWFRAWSGRRWAISFVSRRSSRSRIWDSSLCSRISAAGRCIHGITPSNNIVIIAQYFSELNLSGRGLVRLARSIGVDENLGMFDLGATKPDGSRNTHDRYHGFGNITFQAFMMHGLLVPRITFVGDIVGWGAALPSVEYRVTDHLLARLTYSAIFGAFNVGGLFRDRDQVGARLTDQFS